MFGLGVASRPRAPRWEKCSSEADSSSLPIVSLRQISTTLIDVDAGTSISSQELWKEKPVIIVCFRRPGCVLCRDEAVKVWKLRKVLESIGVGVCAVVPEAAWQQIRNFHPKWWPGPLYIDQDRVLYKALGKRAPLRSFLALANPFSQVWTKYRAAHKAGLQEGAWGMDTVTGGVFVVGSGTRGIVLVHPERVYGDFPSATELLDAARAALEHHKGKSEQRDKAQFSQRLYSSARTFP